MAFNTEIPLFDLPHILRTLTFTDFFWNNYHFQKLEEKLGSMYFSWCVIPEPVVRTEVWCACPDGLAAFFHPVFNSLHWVVSSYEPKRLSCGFPPEPLEEGRWWESSRSLQAAGHSARALLQPLQLPEAVGEEQPVQPHHLTVLPGTESCFVIKQGEVVRPWAEMLWRLGEGGSGKSHSFPSCIYDGLAAAAGHGKIYADFWKWRIRWNVVFLAIPLGGTGPCSLQL